MKWQSQPRINSVDSIPASSRSQLPPGPTGNFLWGSLFAVQRDPLQFLLQTAVEYSGVARFRAGAVPVYLISSPQAVRHVLVDRQRNYSKNTISYNATKDIGEVNVSNADGDEWLRRRRTLQPILHGEQI